MLIDFDSLGYVEHMFSPFFSHRDACVMHVQIYVRVHAFKKVNLLDTYPYIYFLELLNRFLGLILTTNLKFAIKLIIFEGYSINYR